jgi:hypothetical protein
MGYTIKEILATPNPNAIKCIVEPSPAPDKPRGYTSPDQARADPLGAALMAMPGVSNVLIHDGWIAIGKKSDAPWKQVRQDVIALLKNWKPADAP